MNGMNDDEARQEEAAAPDPKDEQIESLTRQLKATTADFYNFRQRTTKERLETRKRATEEVILAMLPVLDNLDRALEAAGSEDAASILKGVEMVQRQFVSVLDGLGVSIIKAEGEKFDPLLHDAAGTEQVDSPELDGKVITERLKGYRTKERVLRPAQVTVGKIKEA